MNSGLHPRIYDAVRRIPPGMVATYGQIAYLIGMPKAAREVGWALAALRNNLVDRPVPWQRVVNAKGEIRTGNEQIRLLEEEGVEIGANGRIDLKRFGWDGLSEA